MNCPPQTRSTKKLLINTVRSMKHGDNEEQVQHIEAGLTITGAVNTMQEV